MNTDEERDTTLEPAHSVDQDIHEVRTGFRAWMADHEGLLKGLSLVVAYGFIILYLALSFALGESSALAKVAAGGIGVALFIGYMLFKLGDTDSDGRTLWQIYRSKQTERWQIRVAVVLWGFIILAFLFILYLNVSRSE